MAFPDDVYSHRTINNVLGQTYDPDKLTRIYAEDITEPAARLAALEQWILDNVGSWGGGGTSYLKYVALLTSNGTDMTATVLENTLGFTPTFSKEGTGIYNILSDDGWPAGRTVMLTSGAAQDPTAGVGPLISYNFFYLDSSTIRIMTADYSTGNFADLEGDAGFLNVSVEIRIYPE